MFEGLMVAMVTPFRNGAVDLEGSERLVEFMLDGGVEGLVVSGSTGEAATCSLEERRALWAFVHERVRGRVPVVAGTVYTVLAADASAPPPAQLLIR